MRNPKLTESIAHIADSAKNIAIIVGIAVTVFGLYKGYKELAWSARNQKLSTFGTVKELIRSDEEQRGKINEILGMDIPELLRKHPTVEYFYDSPEGLKIASVGRHYEELGALVRLDYIDFELVYEVVPFPDQFWDVTEPIRAGARTKWNKSKEGEPKGLTDFWKNFEYLKNRYEKQRQIERRSKTDTTVH
ncbi:MAG TPA: hypothetical protein VH227_06945 [Candidatus Udaeobacter sp.]|jgi:hypothetical protein|nr:hypothetical protein [Candidatus Udaeobacter sp.]